MQRENEAKVVLSSRTKSGAALRSDSQLKQKKKNNNIQFWRQVYLSPVRGEQMNEDLTNDLKRVKTVHSDSPAISLSQLVGGS